MPSRNLWAKDKGENLLQKKSNVVRERDEAEIDRRFAKGKKSPLISSILSF